MYDNEKMDLDDKVGVLFFFFFYRKMFRNIAMPLPERHCGMMKVSMLGICFSSDL